MSKVGFFTRQDSKEAGRRKRGSQEIPLETARKIGPAAVKHMNRAALHPNMPPSGNLENPLVYVLGEAPGETEDQKGRQFIGKSDRLLRRTISSLYRNDIAWDNAVRTRPPDNRDPKEIEIEAFRGVVEKSIQEAKPNVILAVGGFAARWFLGAGVAVTAVRGRKFPVRVGDHVCWMCPIIHPAWILRNENSAPEKIPGEEWHNAFDQDVAAAFALADAGIEPPPIPTNEELLSNLDLYKPGDDIGPLLEQLEVWSKGRRPLGYDLETTHIRPYHTDAKILSASFSDGETTVAYTLDHPDYPWPSEDAELIFNATGDVLLGRPPLIAHNAPFEMEWSAYFWGRPVLDRKGWHCTQQSAFVIDERPGGQKLDHQAQEHLGIPLKSITGNVDRSKLRLLPLDQLLPYNALDAKVCPSLRRAHSLRIAELRVKQPYRLQMERLPALVAAQLEGMPVDQGVAMDFREDYQKQLRDIEGGISRQSEVVDFKKEFKVFEPTNTDHVLALFHDFLKRPECVRVEKGEEKLTTDEAALSAIDSTLSQLILKHRKVSKVLGTYVLPSLLDEPDPTVYPDGLFHCNFNSTFARSGRLTCDEPNLQNWPKRDPLQRVVRRIVRPGSDEVVLSADYGQIEHRVLAMASKDPATIQALMEDYDVHKEWTERVIAEDPNVLALNDNNFKAARSAIKNQLVFPAYYGASARSIAGYIGTSEFVAKRIFRDFWEEFAGVKAWQKRLEKFYKKHGYVRCLTGRLRQGPLSHNMILNSPVQGTASDIVVDGMARISKIARKTGRLWLQPRINIHDDLTFVVPRRKVDEAVEVIVREMLTTPWNWVNVPLSVEVEVGDDWHDMKPIGTYRSDKL